MSQSPQSSIETFAGKRRFRFRSATMVCLGLISAGTAFHFSDDRLEPAEDLMPFVQPLPDVQNNGYVYFLNRTNRDSREIQDFENQKINFLRRSGQNEWRGLMPGRKGVLDRLGTELGVALEKRWIQPPQQDSGEYGRISAAVKMMVCDFSLALETGERPRAWSILTDLQRLSMALIASSPNFESLETGLNIQQQAADVVCEFLAGADSTDEEIKTLEKTWGTPALEKDKLREILNYECQVIREDLVKARAKMIHTSLVFMPDRSRNRMNSQVRLMEDALLETHATHSEALLAWQPDPLLTMSTGKPGWKWDRNAAGREIVDGMASHLWERQNSLGPRVLFQSRAIRVRLALYRWQSAHAGGLPEMLEALVPEYLPSVPVDPWSGRPLLWSSTGGILFSVGPAWQTPGIPLFLKVLNAFNAGFGGLPRPWFSGQPDSPALRLTLPPPPPRAVKLPATVRIRSKGSSKAAFTFPPGPIPPAIPLSPPLRGSPRRLQTSLPLFHSSSSQPRMMKKKLLRVSRKRSEMRYRELAQYFSGNGRIIPEIQPSQNAFDPDVHRKSGRPFPAEKQRAVGDFFPDSVQGAECGAGFGVRHGGHCGKVEPAVRNVSGGAVEKRGAIPQSAGAESVPASCGQCFRRRVSPLFGQSGWLHALAKTLAQGKRDLADVRHLFQGGRDKRGQTFP